MVKWFDPARGFGFVISDSGGPDILLHANVLRNFGQSTVVDGARVVIGVQQTERGMQAVEVFSIEPPKSPEGALLEDFQAVDAEMLRNTALRPARVKWFDKAKGFGFANIFGWEEDVFIHIEVLRASGLADLVAGEAIAIRAIQGRRGLMAAEISHWDRALTDDTAAKMQ
ncbi:cold-shock protein [Pseudooceanicola sp. LIPI14-2-Ac024]|uniref:cold-shock protein n=1 Tax=Pseudooceanicola sp. LIPI14-2-Ac024 TaxID=3344875 RepID=UPI0035CFBF4F